jgi:REP element-mobilizing transposase RayT
LLSLRHERIQKLLERILDETRCATRQVVHYCIQRDHVHVILEADDKDHLSALVRRVVIRFAVRLNKLLGRKNGKVWGDRYHRRDLLTPREVRNALAYIFTNARKHGETDFAVTVGLDRLSSAPAFDRWFGLPRALRTFLAGSRPPWPPPRPGTWLLRTGWWKSHGPLIFGMRPTRPSHAATSHAATSYGISN